jgi:hypothetical protein
MGFGERERRAFALECAFADGAAPVVVRDDVPEAAEDEESKKKSAKYHDWLSKPALRLPCMDAPEPESYFNSNDSVVSDPRRGGEFRKNALRLEASVFERALIVNNVIGQRNLLAVGNLRRKTSAGVSFEIPRRGRAL